MITVTIDPNAGFCFGVEKAIQIAEESLSKQSELYCLGDIVHNELETGRLKKMGLKVIDHKAYKKLKGSTVLIRAHGEPPSTYIYAHENNIQLIEATCPVVLKLQDRIRFTHQHKKHKGQVVIVGKSNHPEVISLKGQTNGEAIVVETIEDIQKIDFSKDVEVFSQTTLSKQKFASISTAIERQVHYTGHETEVKVNRTICGQVANRVPMLSNFCKQHEVILFISGKNSSNGKSLFEICKAANPRSYHVNAFEEIDQNWIAESKSIGISGATSTPPWLMKEIASKLRAL